MIKISRIGPFHINHRLLAGGILAALLVLFPLASAWSQIDDARLPPKPVLMHDVVNATLAGYTQPTIPALRTTADGRIGITMKSEGSQIGFYLFRPEALTSTHFITGAAGAEALVAPVFLVDEEPIFNGQFNHLTVCDTSEFALRNQLLEPSQRDSRYDSNASYHTNPVHDNGQDVYRFELVSRFSSATSGKRTLRSATIEVRVDNPKTATATIASVTGVSVSDSVEFNGLSWFEPMITGDGKMMVARQTSRDFSWVNPNTGGTETTRAAQVYYLYNDSHGPCDVSGWDNAIPIEFAPYDQRINNLYGFAKHPIRDFQGNVISEAEAIERGADYNYPWVDRDGDNVFFTTINDRLAQTDFEHRECDGGCIESADNLRGFSMFGLWSGGKMVQLDGSFNNTDWALRLPAQPEVHLYNNNTYVRVGVGRDQTEAHSIFHAWLSNTGFIDSLENIFHYNPKLKPLTPRDIVWFLSTGKGSDELVFDDYMDKDALVISNMVSAIAFSDIREITNHGGFGTGTQTARIQNSSSKNHASVPGYGEFVGAGRSDGRVEPVALGGVKAKGLWIDADMGLTYNLGANPEYNRVDTENTDSGVDTWFFGLFVNSHSTSGNRNLLTLPSGARVELRDNHATLALIAGSNEQILDLGSHAFSDSSRWYHLGLLVTQNQIEVYSDGFRLSTIALDANLQNQFMLSTGNLYVGHDSVNTGVDAWIDELRVITRGMNDEEVCNHAHGTLAESTSLNGYPAVAHERIAGQLGASSAQRYQCLTDYTDAKYSFLVDAATVGIQLKQPHPLSAQQPRPDEVNNRFCQSCHTTELNGTGLGIDALELNGVVNMENDPRRQPSQPHPRIIGSIPSGWLADAAGNPAPSQAEIHDVTTGGFHVDRALEDANTLVAPPVASDPPTVTAPADIEVEASALLTPVDLGSASATDSIDGALSAVADNLGPFSLGTTDVTWTATDSSGIQGSAVQRVTVVDSTRPVLTIPADLNVDRDGPAAVDIGLATANDIFTVTITDNRPSLFPLGTTEVVWTAEDENGNVAQATQRVTLTLPPDIEPPLVTAPANIELEATGLQTPVDLGNASAVDAVDGALVATANNLGPFDLHVTVVTWSATDAAGNVGTASQTVTIVDTTAPVVTAPSDITRESAVPLALDIGSPQVVEIFEVTLENDAPVLFPIGTTTVTWTVTDSSGNAAQVAQQVTVNIPNRAPTIVSVGNQAGVINQAASVQVVASDADGDSLTYTATGLPPGLAIESNTGVISGTPDSAGVFTVVVSVSDGSASSTSGFTWTVESATTHQCEATRNIAPEGTARQSTSHPAFPASLALNGSIFDFTHTQEELNPSWTVDFSEDRVMTEVVLENRRNCCQHRFRDLTLSVLDASGVAVYQSEVLNPGNTLNGPLTLSVTLPSAVLGRSVRVSRAVAPPIDGNSVLSLAEVQIQGCDTLSDTEAPIVTAPLSITSEATALLTSVSIGTATVTDNIDNDIVASPDNSGPYQLGDTLVTWSATDAAGNLGTASQTVTIVDTTAPVVTAPADVLQESYVPIALALGDPGIIEIFGVATTNDAPSLFVIGTTIVTWTVTDDNGNIGQATQQVTVNLPPDTESPVVVAPDSITLEATALQTAANLGTASAVDALDGSVVATADNLGPFGLGVTVVTWSATDAAGNVGTATQTVTIVDTTAPVVTAPTDITVTSSVPLAIDIGRPAVVEIFGFTIEDDAPELFPLGTTTVTWTVTDDNGNSRQVSQQVSVADVVQPQSLFIEGESSGPSVTSGTHEPQNASQFGWSGDSQLFWLRGAVGGRLTIPLNNIEGRYRLAMNFTRARDYGQFNVTLNGQFIRSIDLYDSAVSTQVFDFGEVEATANSTLVFTITGRNPSSINHYLGLDYIRMDAIGPLVNTPPVVDAGPDRALELGESITLLATADDDGLPKDPGSLSVQWTQVSGAGDASFANASVAQTIVSFSEEGTYVLRLTAHDGEFSDRDDVQVSVNIPVPDTEPPVVTAPADIEMEASALQTPVNLGNASAVDNVDGELVASPDNPGPFGLGVTVVIWSATDAAGNVGTATQTVTIVDTTAPVVTAPTDITVTSSVPLAIDIGQPTVVEIFGFTIEDDAPELFPLGTTTVTWTVTDDNGNSRQVSQQVSVADVVQPQSLFIEGESSGPSVTSGTHEPQNASQFGWSGDSQLFWLRGAVGGRLTIPLNNIEGRYRLAMNFTRARDYGQFNVMLNGQFIRSIDLYDSAVSTEVFDFGEVAVTANSTLVFTITGRNPSSINHYLGLDYIRMDALGPLDNVAPTVTAPASITSEATALLTPVSIGTATVTDNENQNLSASVDNPGPYGLGETTVTWRATDAAGNVGTATQTVTIVDTTAPVVTAPADVTQTSHRATVEIALDEPDIVEIFAVTTTNDAPALFPLGTTTVTWIVTDTSGNASQVTQQVTVTESAIPNRAPTIVPLSDQTAEVNQSASLQVSASDAEGDSLTYTATGLPSGISLASTTGLLSGTPNTAGVFTVVVNVSDGLASSTVSFTWTVEQPRTYQCNTTRNVAPEGSASQSTELTGYPASNALNGLINDFTHTLDEQNPSWTVDFAEDRVLTEVVLENRRNCCQRRLSDVTVSVLDAAGEVVYESAVLNPGNTLNGMATLIESLPSPVLGRSVRVSRAIPLPLNGDSVLSLAEVRIQGCDAPGDEQPPVVTAPASITSEATALLTPVSIGTATVTDNENQNLSASVDNPGPYGLGETTVTWRATDAAGNVGTATQTVTIVDTTAPVVTAPADVTQTSHRATVEIALDEPDIVEIFAVTTTNDAPALFPLGTTTVTWIVTDTSGNASQVTQQVTVTESAIPNRAPTIVPLSDQTAEVNQSASLQVSASDAEGDSLTYTATGLPSGISLASTTGLLSGTPNTAGVFTVVVNVSDGLASSTVSFTWTVEQPRTYQCNTTRNVAPEGSASQSTELTGYPASNALNGLINDFTHTLDEQNPSWTVDFAEDRVLTEVVLENRRNCCQRRLSDVTVSVLDAAGEVVYESAVLNPGNTLNGMATLIESLPSPVLGRSVRVSRAIPLPLNGDSVLSLAEVRIQGCDAPGDEQPPVVTAPASITSEATALLTPVSIGTATVTDNENQNLSASVDNPGPYGLGETTVTWRATDAAGNVGTATQTVTIVDTTAPVVTAPADVTQTSHRATVEIALDEPDIVEIFAVTTTNDAPALFPLGTTTVTWIVTDTSGNASQVTQQVTVTESAIPNRAPTIVPLSDQTAEVNQSASLQVSASDAEGDSLTYTATGLPSGISLASTTGLLSGTPNTAGVFTVVVNVSDGLASSTVSFTWTVEQPRTYQCNTTRNVAPEGSASQSTELTGYPASNALNGLINDFTHTLDEQNPSWTVDFAEDRVLTEVVLENRRNCCQRRLSDVTVSVLDAAGEVVYESAVLNPGNTLNGMATLIESLPSPVLGRSVRVSRAIPLPLNGDSVLSLAEVRIQGCDAPGDEQPPVVTAPASITSEATALLTPVSIGTATVTDNENQNLSASVDNPGPYGLGETTVTWRATDAAGNVGTATQTITIVDTTAPVVTAPSDISRESAVSLALDIGQPEVVEIFAVTIENNAPALFPIGTTTVIWTVTDTSGNASQVAQQVTVSAPNQAPTIVPLGDQTVEVNQPVSLQVSATDADGDSLIYTATGLPPGISIESATGLLTGTPNVLGVFTVVVNISDGLVSSTSRFTWVIERAKTYQCDTIRNIAPEGSAHQSTTLEQFSASLALNGDLNDFTHTLAEPNPSWTVDFAEDRVLTEVVLWNRRSCCQERLSDVTVSVLNAAGEVVYESVVLNPGNTLGSVPRLDILLPNNIVGRSVRVSRALPLDGNGVLSLAEVRVQACDAPLVSEPPTVNAGTDQTVTFFDLAELAAEVTQHSNPYFDLTTTWSQVSGPGVAEFSDSSVQSTKVSFSEVGSYVLRFSVDDGEYLVADEIQIDVEPSLLVSDKDLNVSLAESTGEVNFFGAPSIRPGEFFEQTFTFLTETGENFRLINLYAANSDEFEFNADQLSLRRIDFLTGGTPDVSRTFQIKIWETETGDSGSPILAATQTVTGQRNLGFAFDGLETLSAGRQYTLRVDYVGNLNSNNFDRAFFLKTLENYSGGELLNSTGDVDLAVTVSTAVPLPLYNLVDAIAAPDSRYYFDEGSLRTPSNGSLIQSKLVAVNGPQDLLQLSGANIDELNWLITDPGIATFTLTNRNNNSFDIQLTGVAEGTTYLFGTYAGKVIKVIRIESVRHRRIALSYSYIAYPGESEHALKTAGSQVQSTISDIYAKANVSINWTDNGVLEHEWDTNGDGASYESDFNEIWSAFDNGVIPNLETYFSNLFALRRDKNDTRNGSSNGGGTSRGFGEATNPPRGGLVSVHLFRTPESMGSTLAHELGHNLGLSHISGLFEGVLLPDAQRTNLMTVGRTVDELWWDQWRTIHNTLRVRAALEDSVTEH